MHRRDLLNTAITVGAASLLASESVQAADKPVQPARIVDTNISLFHWPFRRLPLDDLDAMLKKLRTLGISQAWAGSFEGLLHRDIAGVNQRLADACKLHAELVPIGSLNLELSNWEDDLRRCIEKHQMPGVRLHPNYHGYALADPRFSKLVKQATSAGMFIQIAVAMEDTRTQHPMMQVSDVDLAALPKRMQENVGAKVQLLNYRPGGPLSETLAKTPGIYFDSSRIDGTDGIVNLLQSVPHGRIMFGTHAPFLIPEAALIRTFESDLEEEDLQSLMWATADQLQKAQRR